MKTIYTLAFAVCFLMACAAPAPAEWQDFHRVDGLGGEAVNAIFEDSSGNLWFCTGGGVSRYDGSSWRTFSTSDDLPNDLVLSITEDSAGNLWVGTFGGVSRYDGVSWISFTTADGLVANKVNAVAEGRQGTMWFATDNGVSRYDGEEWITYKFADGLPHSTVHTIFKDSSGNLWFGTDRGVSRYIDDGGTARWDNNWLEWLQDGRNRISSIIEDDSGNLWFAAVGAVLCRHAALGWMTYVPEGLTETEDVRAIAQDRSGSVWCATFNGLYRCNHLDYSDLRWRRFSTADGLVNDKVTSAAADRQGNLWFGTVFGVSRHDGVTWTTFDPNNTDGGLPGSSVFAIHEHSSGDTWFGTEKGAARYDGENWTPFDVAGTEGGLAGDIVRTIVEDGSGTLWLGTNHGVSSFDGADWTRFEDTCNLGGGVFCALVDDAGNLWFGTYQSGVCRYDGESWTSFKTSDGLAGNAVIGVHQDRSGDLWFGTLGGGVSRFDGDSWTTFTDEDGLGSNYVYAIAEDSFGNMWFGGTGGATKYDGSNWTNFTTTGGVESRDVYAILEDRRSKLLFGTSAGGVAHYDGLTWTSIAPTGDTRETPVYSVAEDRYGSIWIGHSNGVALYEPDLVSPQTLILQRPQTLSTSTNQTVTFAAAHHEVLDVLFSYSFDGAPWSEWTDVNFWTERDLSDGEHAFEVRARDAFGNVDSSSAICGFEIDATPPTPLISSPVFGQAVQGSTVILGTAEDLRFRKYSLELQALDSPGWTLIAESESPMSDGVLAEWDTRSEADGIYVLRLSVRDTLGLTGATFLKLEVDNEMPWANETAPVIISGARGGNVYSNKGKARVYIPPNGFADDTVLDIVALGASDVPDTLADGARLVNSGFELSWKGAALKKPAVLEMSYGDPNEVAGDAANEPPLALYLRKADSTWVHIGGTVDDSQGIISSPITAPGWYSVFVSGLDSNPGATKLSGISLTPRVFSPRGAYASRDVAIGFTLDRPGPVTVKIYSRSGRLVRDVVSGNQMTTGVNLVKWDGRDSGGEIVEDGLYLVTVEALGEKQVKPLAVVR